MPPSSSGLPLTRLRMTLPAIISFDSFPTFFFFFLLRAALGKSSAQMNPDLCILPQALRFYWVNLAVLLAFRSGEQSNQVRDKAG